MLSSRVLFVSALALLAAACGSSDSTTSPTPTPAPVTSGSGTPITIPTGAETLGNRAFSPDAADVAVGTTVTWTNTDSVSHTSTSDVKGWDSGIVGPGQQYSVAFQTPGTFSYHCLIHPGMVGTVVVR